MNVPKKSVYVVAMVSIVFYRVYEVRVQWKPGRLETHKKGRKTEQVSSTGKYDLSFNWEGEEDNSTFSGTSAQSDIMHGHVFGHKLGQYLNTANQFSRFPCVLAISVYS